ncbi:MAG: hypothetical protein WBQ75_22130 [Acetobacteraceae bacterium]
MQVKATLIAAVAALALSGGAAFAGGTAIGNDTTTSMGAPSGSPGYTAPRSAVVPGLPPQTREAQEENAVGGRHVDQSPTAPVQGPTNPMTGRTQTTN